MQDLALEDIKKIAAKLPTDEYALVGWWQQNGNFFAALALEKKALFVVLMLIIVVASLNIISSLLMTVMSRRKEIALLLSLGADQNEIKSIFFRLGAIIGGSGIAVGTILGFIALALLANFDIISLPADVYGTTKLPLELSVIDLVFILVGSIAVVFVSSYYPAKKASEVDPLSVLRNE
jgi:putative ABC transport system permease protein